jgi:tRNA threonylcarbamoyladenosine biosynthesis protein TsaB
LADPLILAFDTSAAHCAAALLSGDRVLAERVESMYKGQAERLFPMLKEMLAGAGVAWRDLSAIGVGTGPGNFTGVRIAVAAARGLALSLGVPAQGVTGFEALGFGLPRPVMALIDGRAGRIYAQVFDAAGAHDPLTVDATGDFAALQGLLGIAVAGHEAARIASLVGGHATPPSVPVAVAVARIAASRPAAGLRPAPLYLRPADAAPPREGPPLLLP